MTQGRPPRKPRWPASRFTIASAILGASRLTDAELAVTLQPLQTAFTAMRQGVGSYIDWAVVCSAINCAQAIEKQGVVCKLAGYFHAAELALQGIQHRAVANGQWHAVELYFQEIEDITEAIAWHEFQLKNLSASEVKRAARYAEAEVRSSGGRVMQQADLLAA